MVSCARSAGAGAKVPSVSQNVFEVGKGVCESSGRHSCIVQIIPRTVGRTLSTRRGTELEGDASAALRRAEEFKTAGCEEGGGWKIAG